MAFDILATQRVSCVGQYDRIDDLIPCVLRGNERPVSRQFLVREFHFPAVVKCFDPIFIPHARTPSYEVKECLEYTFFGSRKCGSGIISRITGHLGSSTHMSGYRVNQAYARRRFWGGELSPTLS